VDECANNQYATARCRPEAEADNRVVVEGEDGYFSGTTGLPVGLHQVCRSAPFFQQSSFQQSAKDRLFFSRWSGTTYVSANDSLYSVV